VGELEVGDDRAVGVPAANPPDIHAYNLNVYYSFIKKIFSIRLPTGFSKNPEPVNAIPRVYRNLWS
jgi:hypothetical protein